MAGRKVVLANGEYYHIFNRGIACQPVFLNKRDYERFLLTFDYYRFSNPSVRLSRFLQFPLEERTKVLQDIRGKGNKIVETLCFSLLPNHYHLLIKQVEDKGISIYLNKLTNSYTRYFNVKRKRVGDLFQGVFKAVHIETEEQLIHLSRYIHLNPLVSFVVSDKEFFSYPWSSLFDYLKGSSLLVDISTILSFFKSSEAYKKFILDRTDYAKKLEEIKHLTCE